MSAVIFRSAGKLWPTLTRAALTPSVANFSTSDTQQKVPPLATGKASPAPERDADKMDKTHAALGAVVDDSEIQPEWLAMERRLSFRKPKLKGEGKEGRSPLRGSAWDAEHV